jgi:hypothetical protein
MAFCNLYITLVSPFQSDVLDFVGKYHIKSKLAFQDEIVECVSNFYFLGCHIFSFNKGIEIQMTRFNQICVAVRRTLEHKSRKKAQRVVAAV